MFGPVILAKADNGEGPDQMPSRPILQNDFNVFADYVRESTMRLQDEKPQAS